MKMLDYLKRLQLWRFGWHILIALLVIAAVITGLIGDANQDDNLSKISEQIYILAFWLAFFAFLLSSQEIIRSIKENSDKLDNVVDMMSRNNNLLSQNSQAIRLSDSAKEIAFRDIERMELAEAVIAKLHQHEFDATFAMIDAMARRTEYKGLSAQLKKTAEQYRDATEKERIAQAVTHIIQLGQEHRWTQAYRQLDNLIKGYPYSDQAKAVREKLKRIKLNRKKELLALWDDAVKAKDTDRSLGILKDLDTYLTPSEALALQDAASTVFKTKLHNLGVRFALAVTENQWSGALNTGQQIIRDFPNSRMSYEIKSKMDILQERAKTKAATTPDKKPAKSK